VLISIRMSRRPYSIRPLERSESRPRGAAGERVLSLTREDVIKLIKKGVNRGEEREKGKYAVCQSPSDQLLHAGSTIRKRERKRRATTGKAQR